MPELPDVEVFRRYMNATALSKKIIKTQVFETDLLEDVSAAQLARRMTNSQFNQTKRHGKYLFARVSGGDWLILHFGMTGFLEYFKHTNGTPEHARMLLHFKNGFALAYICQRKLGKIGWTGDISEYLKIHDLGPDAFSDELDEENFKDLIHGNRGTIKSRLMNQSIIAGLGNIYTDEILFQAGVHPETSLDALKDEDQFGLFYQMKRILDLAIEKKVDPEMFPVDTLLPNREEGHQCPKCGGKIKKIKVGGRSAFFCEKHQKPPA
ncbi:Fpg/Nei family DNA glycosylase [bacterium]|nr:Fpg/Nei family DNA glycosylase [bacterium]